MFRWTERHSIPYRGHSVSKNLAGQIWGATDGLSSVGRALRWGIEIRWGR